MEIFYINLDSRIDRRKYLESQLKDLKLRATRVVAISVSRDSEGLSRLTLPVLSCLESHREIYKQTVQGSEEFALIIEDDIHIKNKKLFRKLINSIDSSLTSNDFDCIQLGYVEFGVWSKLTRAISDVFCILEIYLLCLLATQSRKLFGLNITQKVRVRSAMEASSIRAKLKSNWFIPGDFKAGTHCYIVNRKFADQIRKLNMPPFLSADLFLMSLSQMNSFKIYRIVGNKFKQSRKMKSDIDLFRFKIVSD